jgi:PAS domain-containing protein
MFQANQIRGSAGVDEVDATPGAWDNFWLPSLLWLGLFLIDRFLIPGVFSLPLLLLLALIFLSFRLPAWMVAIWALMYGASVFAILMSPIKEAATDPALRPYVRTCIFLAGGAAAVLLASHRQRLERGHQALFRIIAALPLPVIVSDVSGNILLLNNAAQAVLKRHISDLAGLSFFSTFVSPNDQGKAIARYIGYFDPGHAGPVSTALRTRGEPSLTLHSSISVVRIDRSRYAVTVVERVE